MKIYTRTGDLGETGLFGGPRVMKDSLRIEALGAVDELNATLGMVRTEEVSGDLEMILARVQAELFEVGAELASPDPVARGTRSIGLPQIEFLEQAIDRFEASLEPLKCFILPAGVRAAASLHLARAVCRRAERRLVTLRSHCEEEVSGHLVGYLNRLGDLLFVLARTANSRAGVADVSWHKPRAQID
jgi:cob(I)alamin adenosyltransferase